MPRRNSNNPCTCGRLKRAVSPVCGVCRQKIEGRRQPPAASRRRAGSAGGTFTQAANRWVACVQSVEGLGRVRATQRPRRTLSIALNCTRRGRNWASRCFGRGTGICLLRRG